LKRKKKRKKEKKEEKKKGKKNPKKEKREKKRARGAHKRDGEKSPRRGEKLGVQEERWKVKKEQRALSHIMHIRLSVSRHCPHTSCNYVSRIHSDINCSEVV
jgi:hypothetical protein